MGPLLGRAAAVSVAPVLQSGQGRAPCRPCPAPCACPHSAQSVLLRCGPSRACAAAAPSPGACSKPARDSRARVAQKHEPTAASARRPSEGGRGCWPQAGRSRALVLQSRWAASMPRPLPEVSVSCERSEVSCVAGPSGCIQEPLAWVEATDEHAAGDGLHVSARQPTVEPVAPEDTAPHGVRAFPEEGGAGLRPRGGRVRMSSGRRAAGPLPAGNGRGAGIPSDGPFPSSLLAGSRAYRRRLWARSVFNKE